MNKNSRFEIRKLSNIIVSKDAIYVTDLLNTNLHYFKRN